MTIHSDEAASEVKTGSLLARSMGVVGSFFAVALLLGLIALGTLVWRVRAGYFSAVKEIEAEVARIRTVGEPLTRPN